ncbi:hypothetical protein KDH83_12200 [Achromobacter sp. Marseille-Q0513]|uniref:fascin domain-containing protein n=1 Tax=Achromobacter sp. Marseille-Q0513 TaxID=2829161 RepID=UPI001B8DAFBD|nr:hypothetical protein [Achromobacter sp. Marseille-Q0513]MBR8654057.1 hypothetical protein [Achromobacter sp. Marseille-Q0513]
MSDIKNAYAALDVYGDSSSLGVYAHDKSSYLCADVSSLRRTSQFTVEPQSTETIALKASNGLYLSRYYESASIPGAIRAAKKSIDEFCVFTVERADESDYGIVYLKADNGNYLSVVKSNSDNKRYIRAVRPKPDSLAKFRYKTAITAGKNAEPANDSPYTFNWEGIQVTIRKINGTPIPYLYNIYLPDKVCKQLSGTPKKIAQALGSISAYIANLLANAGKMAIPVAAAALALSTWMAIWLFVIWWQNKGQGVTLVTYGTPFQPYWACYSGHVAP